MHGIKTAMDDFGSGYSVLNTIVDIPVDVIKIDRGFITSCLETDRGIYFLEDYKELLQTEKISKGGGKTPKQAKSPKIYVRQ